MANTSSVRSRTHKKPTAPKQSAVARAKSVQAAPATKAERSDIRLTADTKMLIQQAAGLLGTTVTAFVVNHSYEAAKRVISEHNAIMLTATGQRDLLELLRNPPLPNEALLALLNGSESKSEAF